MTALYLKFHAWRGFALTNVEPDLFSYVYGLGFCTIYVCRGCLVDAYRKLKRTIGDAIDMAEGR